MWMSDDSSAGRHMVPQDFWLAAAQKQESHMKVTCQWGKDGSYSRTIGIGRGVDGVSDRDL